MKRAWIVWLVVIIGAALAMPVIAGEGAKKKGVRGKVAEVNKDKNTITIETGKKDNKESKTFDVAKDARINVDGKDATLGDVKVGMRVKIKLGDDGKTAIAITARERKKKEK